MRVIQSNLFQLVFIFSLEFSVAIVEQSFIEIIFIPYAMSCKAIQKLLFRSSPHEMGTAFCTVCFYYLSNVDIK